MIKPHCIQLHKPGKTSLDNKFLSLIIQTGCEDLNTLDWFWQLISLPCPGLKRPWHLSDPSVAIWDKERSRPILGQIRPWFAWEGGQTGWWPSGYCLGSPILPRYAYSHHQDFYLSIVSLWWWCWYATRDGIMIYTKETFSQNFGVKLYTL